MASKTKHPTVRNWLKRLVAKVPVAHTATEIEASITLYIPTLAQMPEAVFCDSSLEAIGPRFAEWPSIAELADRLREWRVENTDKYTVGVTRAASEIPAWLAAVMGDTERQRVEQEKEHANYRRDWADVANVRHSIAACQGNERHLRLLRGAIARWAPQNSDLIPPPPEPTIGREMPPELSSLIAGVPDDIAAKVVDMVEKHGADETMKAIMSRVANAKLRPTPSYLTPDQLAEARRTIARDNERPS
jgi:hypothetical protein